MVVTWVTFDPTNSSEVQYNLHGSTVSHSASGNVTTFVDGGLSKSVRYIHRVTLTSLLPLQKYGEPMILPLHTHSKVLPPLDYRCGSPANWSRVFTLRTFGDEEFAPTFAVYGDFGTENARSLPLLIAEAFYGTIDGVLHCGDIAYNLFNVRLGESSALYTAGRCVSITPLPTG